MLFFSQNIWAPRSFFLKKNFGITKNHNFIVGFEYSFSFQIIIYIFLFFFFLIIPLQIIISSQKKLQIIIEKMRFKLNSVYKDDILMLTLYLFKRKKTKVRNSHILFKISKFWCWITGQLFKSIKSNVASSARSWKHVVFHGL